jgi:putative toxin-antitoxin system antitoxin component (TIGR02293 family)
MTVGSGEVAKVLGLGRNGQIESGLDLAEALEKGFPVAALDRVCRLIAPGDPAFRGHVIARATLARRKRQNRLTTEESERVERLARLWTFARDVWGDDEAARRFLNEPHPLLRGRRPLDVARTDVGAHTVEEILGRLKYGTAA